MKPGAILTKREAEAIRRRLAKIPVLTDERRVREQCRLICADINKATRRVERRGAGDPKLF